MNPMVRYSLMRITLLAAVLLGVYAFGARGVLWLVLSAVISAALAYLLLRGPRDDVARRLAARTEGRIKDNLDRRVEADNAAEDADARDADSGR